MSKPRRRSTSAKVSRLPPLDIQQRYTIPETCAYLRISRSRFYTKLKANEIAIIKDGGRVLVAGAEIAAQSRPH